MKHSGRRWAILLTGIALGAAGMAVLGSYHCVQTTNGRVWIPRTSTGWSNVYVDVSRWTSDDWRKNPGLMQAVVRSEHRALLPPDLQVPRARNLWDMRRTSERPVERTSERGPRVPAPR